MIGPKCADYQSTTFIGHKGELGRVVRIGARLVLDRTPVPASYVQSEIKRTSEQLLEEGGQKEEGEKKK